MYTTTQAKEGDAEITIELKDNETGEIIGDLNKRVDNLETMHGDLEKIFDNEQQLNTVASVVASMKQDMTYLETVKKHEDDINEVRNELNAVETISNQNFQTLENEKADKTHTHSITLYNGDDDGIELEDVVEQIPKQSIAFLTGQTEKWSTMILFKAADWRCVGIEIPKAVSNYINVLFAGNLNTNIKYARKIPVCDTNDKIDKKYLPDHSHEQYMLKTDYEPYDDNELKSLIDGKANTNHSHEQYLLKTDYEKYDDTEIRTLIDGKLTCMSYDLQPLTDIYSTIPNVSLSMFSNTSEEYTTNILFKLNESRSFGFEVKKWVNDYIKIWFCGDNGTVAGSRKIPVCDTNDKIDKKYLPSHTHTVADIEGIDSKLNNKADIDYYANDKIDDVISMIPNQTMTYWQSQTEDYSTTILFKAADYRNVGFEIPKGPANYINVLFNGNSATTNLSNMRKIPVCGTDDKININYLPIDMIYPIGSVFQGTSSPSFGSWKKIGYHGYFENRLERSEGKYFVYSRLHGSILSVDIRNWTANTTPAKFSITELGLDWCGNVVLLYLESYIVGMTYTMKDDLVQNIDVRAYREGTQTLCIDFNYDSSDKTNTIVHIQRDLIDFRKGEEQYTLPSSWNSVYYDFQRTV